MKNKIEAQNVDEQRTSSHREERIVRQSSEIDEVSERMIAYRKEHFAVEVGPSRWGYGGEINVSITSNGYQWQNISLMPDEIEKVMNALKPFLMNDERIRAETKP